MINWLSGDGREVSAWEAESVQLFSELGGYAGINQRIPMSSPSTGATSVWGSPFRTERFSGLWVPLSRNPRNDSSSGQKVLFWRSELDLPMLRWVSPDDGIRHNREASRHRLWPESLRVLTFWPFIRYLAEDNEWFISVIPLLIYALIHAEKLVDVSSPFGNSYRVWPESAFGCSECVPSQLRCTLRWWISVQRVPDMRIHWNDHEIHAGTGLDQIESEVPHRLSTSGEMIRKLQCLNTQEKLL
jgi:hypothetical protein